MDKVLTKIMNDVAEKHGIPREQAELIYMNMFKFIRETVTAVDFDGVETEADLRKLKVNFNIPRVFKLYTTKGRVDYAREVTRKKAAEHGEGVDADDNIESTEGIS
jgi:hypothetical protein